MSSKSLKLFSKELFFCSGLRNTYSLGRGGRYQYQDNQMVSLVLLNNIKRSNPPMYRPRPCFDMMPAIDQYGRHDRSLQITVPLYVIVNFFIVIIPFRPAHILNRLWRSRRWRTLSIRLFRPNMHFDVVVSDNAVAPFAFCWFGGWNLFRLLLPICQCDMRTFVY